MAAYVNQYVTTLLKGEIAIQDKVGLNVMGGSAEGYKLHVLTLTLLGVVMKKVSEVAPAVTDAVWQDALAHALDQGATPATQWPAWVLNQTDPAGP